MTQLGITESEKWGFRARQRPIKRWPKKLLNRTGWATNISARRTSKKSKPIVFSGHVFRSAPRKNLVAIIEQSRALLKLESNWDDNGSPAYSHTTWNRAVEFVLLYALHFSTRYKKAFPVPRILPGPEGSIDLFCRDGDRELLINIPMNADESASYYGKTWKEDLQTEISGNLNTESSEDDWLFLWLTK